MRVCVCMCVYRRVIRAVSQQNVVYNNCHELYGKKLLKTLINEKKMNNLGDQDARTNDQKA